MRGEKGGISLANRDGWSQGPPVVPSNWWKYVQTLGFLCWPSYGNLTIDTDTELEREGRESLPMVFVINAEMANKIRILGNKVAVTEHVLCGIPESFLPTAWELNEWKSKRYEKHQWFLLYSAFPVCTHNKPSNIFFPRRLMLGKSLFSTSGDVYIQGPPSSPIEAIHVNWNIFRGLIPLVS